MVNVECGVSMVMVMAMAMDFWMVAILPRGRYFAGNSQAGEGKKELELVKMAGNKKILPAQNPKSKMKIPADGRRRRRRFQ